MGRSFLVLAALLTAACSPAAQPPAPAAAAAPADNKPLSVLKMNGPLVAANVTMVAAWEFPKNPMTDKTLDDSRQSKEIRRGFQIFTNTPAEVPHMAPGSMS